MNNAILLFLKRLLNKAENIQGGGTEHTGKCCFR